MIKYSSSQDDGKAGDHRAKALASSRKVMYSYHLVAPPLLLPCPRSCQSRIIAYRKKTGPSNLRYKHNDSARTLYHFQTQSSRNHSHQVSFVVNLILNRIRMLFLSNPFHININHITSSAIPILHPRKPTRTSRSNQNLEIAMPIGAYEPAYSTSF